MVVILRIEWGSLDRYYIALESPLIGECYGGGAERGTKGGKIFEMRLFLGTKYRKGGKCRPLNSRDRVPKLRRGLCKRNLKFQTRDGNDR